MDRHGRSGLAMTAGGMDRHGRCGLAMTTWQVAMTEKVVIARNEVTWQSTLAL